MSTPIPLVELSGQQVLLRPYRLEDASALFAAAVESVETVGRWMPWRHAGYAAAESVAWIEKCHAMWQSGEQYEFGAFDSENHYVGGGGLHQFNSFHNYCALGYWVRQSRQRRGFAPEVARLLAKFGFETLRVTRIEIVAASENAASRRVAETVGGQFECVARNRLVIHGVPVAAAVYSLVPSVAT